jgi:hypothetical protein
MIVGFSKVEGNIAKRNSFIPIVEITQILILELNNYEVVQEK